MAERVGAPLEGFKVMQTQEAMIEDNLKRLRDIPSGGDRQLDDAAVWLLAQRDESPLRQPGADLQDMFGLRRQPAVQCWALGDAGDFFYRRPAWQ